MEATYHSYHSDDAMPIDRNLWREEIASDYVPNWPCPNCGAASLSVFKDSFQSIEDRDTRRYRDRDDFDPICATGKFICLLICTKTGCREVCAVSGSYTTSEDFNEHGPWHFDSGRPASITPPPPMIPIPKDCPEHIRHELSAAFALYWCDHAACLNRIRNSLELILTDLKVPRLEVKNSKRRRLTLHSRIEKLKSDRPKLGEVCNRMLAVKHLGNAGSHPEEVTADDVFDGFDILERVLHDTYSDHESELAKIVARINKQKGPRKGRG